MSAFYLAYPGFVEDTLAELRYATLAEMRDDLGFFWYNIDYFQKLRLDPATGMYDFTEAVRRENFPGGFEAGQMSYHHGDFPQAITRIEADIEARGESEKKLLWLALSHMRRAEQEGCLESLRDEPHDTVHEAASGWRPDGAHPHPRICSLPAEAAAGAAPGMAEAARIFEKLLDVYDPDDKLYRWLLNFSYMALGRFPEGVPPRYVIESDFVDAFYGRPYEETAARFENLVFRDRARELGVDVNDAGKGVAVEDFDGDGFLDLVTGGSFSNVRFFHNDGGRRFLDKTEEVGLDGVLQPFIITAADYDNDGWMDLFVGRPYHVFSLFRNRGDGTFVDVTRESGLLSGIKPGQSVFTFVSAWADVDNDGDLDLFLAQLGRKLPLAKGLLGKDPMSSKLFRNDGVRFTDATAAFGLALIVDDRTFTGAAFGDYNGDGFEDLFLSSFTRGVSVLLRNVEGRRFEATDLVHNPDPGFMASFVDIDHDGRLDLFQGSNGPASSVVENAVFGAASGRSRPGRYTNKIYVQGESGFEERSDLFGAGMPIGTMGASYGDVNNDGCHDFYLGTGNSEAWFVLPNLMYAGESDGTRCTGMMTNISMLHGFGSIQKGHGIVFFDFDNDGDQDIYSSLGGMWPADPWPNQLFVNDSRLQNSWVKIRLRGRKSNRFGVGARIRVVARNARGDQIIRHQRIRTGTGLGGVPYLAHVGLADAVRIDRVEVLWCGSQTPRVYSVRLSELNTLDEDNGSWSE